MRFLSWPQVMELASEIIEPYGNIIRFAASPAFGRASSDSCSRPPAARCGAKTTS